MGVEDVVLFPAHEGSERAHVAKAGAAFCGRTYSRAPAPSISARREGSTSPGATKPTAAPAARRPGSLCSANMVMPLRVTGTVNTCRTRISPSPPAR